MEYLNEKLSFSRFRGFPVLTAVESVRNSVRSPPTGSCWFQLWHLLFSSIGVRPPSTEEAPSPWSKRFESLLSTCTERRFEPIASNAVLGRMLSWCFSTASPEREGTPSSL